MLPLEELQSLIGDLESDRVERTTSTTNTDKFCEAVCAFANDLPNHGKPGYLLIGVQDEGKLNGLKADDKLLKNLAGIRSDGNVLPQPKLNIDRYTLPEGDVVVVEVFPGDLPPVRYKGRIWVRCGPRRAIANEQEERALTEKRCSHVRTFDARPCREAAIQDLSLRLFEEYRAQVVDPAILAANHRSLKEQLASLRFFDLRQDCPTFAGILLFGKNPRYYLPGAYIQYLHFPHDSITDEPLDQHEFSGDLRTLLDLLRDRFRATQQTRMIREEGFNERLVPDYPEWAIRELLHNAVMHRDYESNTPVRFYWFADRIEIQSPGGLYGEVTKETITRCNSYRNPVMAEAMKTLGYVNRFGYGIQRAQEELRKNGNPPPEFDCGDRVVGVTVRRRPQ